MKNQSFTEDEVKKAVEKLADDLTTARQPALNSLSKRLQKRGIRLKKVEDKLVEDLGENNPEVIRLRETLKRNDRLKLHFDTQSRRAANLRKPKEYERLVHGSIIDRKRTGQKGLVVQLYDKDVRENDLLGEVTTDKHGDFQIYYHERDYEESGEGAPELFIVVKTKRGRKLHTTEKSPRKSFGKVEYYEIVLN